MKSITKNILILMTATLLYACGAPGKQEATKVGNPPLPQLSLDGIYAVGLINNKEPIQTGGHEAVTIPSTIVGIQASGKTLVLDDRNFVVNTIRGISGGFLMNARRIGSDKHEMMFTRIDGKIFELPYAVAEGANEAFAEFVGQSFEQDLYFRDGKILKFNSGSWSSLNVNLESAHLEEISEHHALIRGKNSIEQIFDLNTGSRFNVDRPLWLVSLNTSTALIDPSKMISTQDGRQSGVSTRLVHKAISGKSGVIAITDQCEGQSVRLMSPNGFLCLISKDLSTSLLLDEEMPNKPESLTTSGDYILIRELDNLFVVKIGTKRKSSILKDYNVFEAHLSEGFVYYRAETRDGKLLTNVYDIERETSYEVADWSSMMTQIQAIRK